MTILNGVVGGMVPEEEMFIGMNEERQWSGKSVPKIERGAEFLSEEELMLALPVNMAVVAIDEFGKKVIFSSRLFDINNPYDLGLLRANEVGAKMLNYNNVVIYKKNKK
ncbi:hypothetical protein KAI92_01700 [Candidatus Parcubacteria bacterium]|nr:hypothetical protein [Candidatus Parcubacteria bacterium]